MAHYAKPLSFLFLILISTSLHAEARERLFFSKATHTTTNNPLNSESLQLAPALAPAPTSDDLKPSETSTTGYGLYGQESDDFRQTRTKTTPAVAAATTTGSTAVFPYDENEIQTEELSDKNYKEEEMARGYTDNNNNNNNGYSNNQNAYTANGYMTSNYYNGRNGYAGEKLGMSDTRFMENGKYYYNAKSENNYYSANGYDSGTGRGNSEGYDNGNGENEFDSMEEYERQQGYYTQSREEYVP